MYKKLILFFTLLIVLCSLSPAADPFYTNLLAQGKALVLAGKYDDALENFKIAEFGLIDEKELVPELYYYYALAEYKKGAIAESQALLKKMKLALAVDSIEKLPKPKEIEHDLTIMLRALDYLDQPGAKPGSLPFFNLFYETWELLKAKKLPESEVNLKRLDKMGGDAARLDFLEGFLAFQKGDYKKCARQLEKIDSPLPVEFREDASFFLAYSYLKLADPVMSEKYARNITHRDYIHRLMVLMDELKAAQAEKGKKK